MPFLVVLDYLPIHPFADGRSLVEKDELQNPIFLVPIEVESFGSQRKIYIQFDGVFTNPNSWEASGRKTVYMKKERALEISKVRTARDTQGQSSKTYLQ